MVLLIIRKGFFLAIILAQLISIDLYADRKSEENEYNLAKKAVPSEYKKFVIVVPSFNNEKFCAQNLQSILKQDYPSFRVIYIDDASTDKTYEIAKQTIEMFNAEDKVELVHNSLNKGAMYNTFRAVHSCANDEIVCIVDGDDWLAKDNVLTTLNEYYANPHVWITYGQYVDYPRGAKGMSAPIAKKILTSGRIKYKAWTTSHLRTFYAGLFNRIKLEDFMYQGEFFPMAADVAAMLPMIEMAREHTYYIRNSTSGKSQATVL